MKRFLLLALLAPTLAMASDCEFSQPRSLDLDLAGIRSVRIEVNSHDLRLVASTPGNVSFGGRACASSQELLPQLVLTQQRRGDQMVIVAERKGVSSGIFFRPTYARLELEARLPPGLHYEVDVGSGDARVSGLGSLRADVGSGDFEATGIAGRLTADVGSGDLVAEDIGELVVDSVGSGDLEASRIRGDVRVGDIGSGDLELRDVGGNVVIDSVGSGDAGVSNVAGDLRVRRVGSGDVDSHGVRGRTELPSDD